VPGVEAGKPAGNVAAVGFVVGTEELSKVRLLIEAYKKGDEQDGDAGDDERREIRVAEEDPEADPASEKTDVHGIADIAVKADDHEALRGSDGSGCTVAGPAEIPNATKGDCEAEDGGNCGEPAPASGVEGCGSEA